MIIDTHAHLNFSAFKEDGKEVIAKTLKEDIWMIMPGSQQSTSRRAVEIANQYPEGGVYAAVGLHPVHLEKRAVGTEEVEGSAVFETRGEEFDYAFYKSLAGDSKAVAIGECGLDSYRLPKRKSERRLLKEKQKDVLRQHINLARELDLPVIFHCRGSLDDLVSLIAEYKRSVRGVVHSFTGTAEQAKKFLELGLFIGFNGIIFRRNDFLPNPEDAVAAVPLERILLETDAPYLMPPQAVRETALGAVGGTVPPTRNEPRFVRFVAEEIARIKELSFNEVANTTTQNAKDLFRLPLTKHEK